MISGSVARRYAKALYELVDEEGGVAETAAALSELAQAIESLDDGTLAPGLLDGDERRRLALALAAPVGVETTLGKFVRLLSERDRVGILPSIHEWFVRIEDRAAGRVRLTLRAAAPLEQSQVDSVVAAFGKITDGNIAASVETDADLIGGALVELEGRVFDGSVKTKLTRLAARMAGDS
jgi:F-type H+-transporting ATPase subunit delta